MQRLSQSDKQEKETFLRERKRSEIGAEKCDQPGEGSFDPDLSKHQVESSVSENSGLSVGSTVAEALTSLLRWSPIPNQKPSKFAVVEFSDDQEVEIVSGAWLTENKSKCYWPNYKSLAKVQLAIKNGKEPDSEFTCLDIRVLYETDDYLKARQNLRKAQYTSDLQTEAEEEEKDNERKRTKRPNPRYQSLSSSDSEDDCKESSKVSKSSKPLPEYPVLPALPLPKSPQPSVKQHISSPSPSPSLSPTPSTSKQFPTLFGSPKQINSSAVEVKFLTALEEIKAQVKHNTHMLQAVLKWIDSKDNVEEQYGAINYEFPIATMETLLEIDDKLDSTEFYKSLLHNLGMIGGDTVPSSVRRILKYIMTDEVAKKINWSGKGGKQAFSSMRLSGLLPKAVRKNRLCTSATDNEIAKTAKDWFRFASDRNGGRRNRMNKTIQNNSI